MVQTTPAVFHRKRTTKATLKHLAFRRPSGLTPPEARDLLNRQCYRPLRKLAENNEIHATDWNNTTVYTHSWPSRQDDQLSQHQTDQPTDLTPNDDDADGYLYRDELIATFLSVAVSQTQSITPERAAALVLRQFEGDSSDALKRRLRRNYSFRETLEGSLINSIAVSMCSRVSVSTACIEASVSWSRSYLTVVLIGHAPDGGRCGYVRVGHWVDGYE